MELDLFQVGTTEKGKSDDQEPSRRSPVQLDLFQVKNEKEAKPKEQERGAAELNLFGNKEKSNERDSKAYALISQSPSGNWVQKESSESKVRALIFSNLTISSYNILQPFPLFLPTFPTLPSPSQVVPFKLNLVGLESKVRNENHLVE